MSTTLGYSNLIDSATVTGGNVTNLSNLKTRYLAQKATASANSFIDVDLGSAKSVGMVALVSETITSGFVSIEAGTTSGGTNLYSSGQLTVYSGTDFAHTFGNVTARYWRIFMSVGGTIGRVFIGPRFQPAVNIDWNPSLAIESRTGISEALSGPEYFETRPSRRVWQGRWSWLSEAEALAWVGIQRAIDVSGEVYLIYDDQDTTYRGTRNFLGRLRTLGPIEYPYLSQYTTALEISELL